MAMRLYITLGVNNSPIATNVPLVESVIDGPIVLVRVPR